MYEAFYGFSGKPFQLNPDPTFYYGSKGHTSAYSYLQYGVYQSEGFIVVTGDIGTGKTTLVRALLEQLDPSKVIAVQLVSTLIDADDLLKAVATAFGIPIKGTEKAELLGTLEAFLTSLVGQSKRALLIVDEAQNLTPRALEELRMLSNFQFGDRALLQSFLVGQPELRQLLQAPTMEQLRQRVIASYHLGPLAADETAAYIQHRLHHVGWNPESLVFDATAYAAIHAATGGIPRKINTLANRLLLSAYLAEKRAITGADVNAVTREISGELGAGHARKPSGAGSPELVRESVARNNGALAAISARLDRIERTLALLLEAIRPEAVSKPERRTGGTKSGRQARL
ncbi:MAG: XrtA-associated ATPase [Burkholderiaceae bacterium]